VLGDTKLEGLCSLANINSIAAVACILGFTEDGELEPDKVLFNLSSRVLTEVEKRVLSKGLKFVLPRKKLSFEKHLLTFEKFYRSISKFSMCSNDIIDSQIFKNTLREIAFKSFKDFKKNVSRNFSCEEELAALENLSKDDSIIIARPDKGN